MAAAAQAPAQRDMRLDVFRGLAMVIIFIAHLPENPWTEVIPAKFGFSSAAEMFVFCSGLASSLAFGRTFLSHPFHVGTLRVVHRVWQVYWAHLALCMIVMAVTAFFDGWNGRDYFAEWGFGWFRSDPTSAFVGLFSLRLMPALLNILPMYLVLLAMIPPVMLLARLHRLLPLAAAAALWLTVQVSGLNLHSGVHLETEWFFDPFAWQLLFFTGFSFGMGWLKPPRFGFGTLFRLAVAFLVISVPFTWRPIVEHVPFFAAGLDWLMPDTRPIRLHVLRYVHFLALAYVVLSVIEKNRHWLAHPLARPLTTIGQQTLQSFQASIVLACGLGVLLDAEGRSFLFVALANIAGLVLVYATARVTAFFKAPPWKQRRAAAAAPAPAPRPFTEPVTQT